MAKFMRATTVAASLVALLLLTTPQEAVPESSDWEVVLLDSPSSWPQVYPNNVNEKGNIIGFWQESTGAQHAVLWKDAKSSPTQLATLPGDSVSLGMDVNASGVACGSSGPVPFSHGVIWDNQGKVHDLHPEDYQMSQVWGINDRGDACGRLFQPGVGQRPYAWPKNDDPFMPDCDGTVYYGGFAMSIDKGGRMAGLLWDKASGGWAHAIVWTSAGEAYDLHEEIVDAFEDDELLYSIAWEATDSGEVCGEAGTWTESYVWVWTVDDGVRFLDQEDTTVALAWQSAGKYVIGSIGGTDVAPDGAEAAVWRRGTEQGKTTWTLHTIPVPEGYVGMVAIGANQEGGFVGMAARADGTVRAWHTKFPQGK
jgi:hypothetical protein